MLRNEYISPLRDDAQQTKKQPEKSSSNNNNSKEENGSPSSSAATTTTSSTATGATGMISSPPFLAKTSIRNNEKSSENKSASPIAQTNDDSPFSVPNASPIPTSTNNNNRSTAESPPQQLPLVWRFPGSIDLPSRDLIQMLYEQAILPQQTPDEKPSDQITLSRYGILSFEDVLLLAASYQHNQALRSMQSILKRDHPNCVYQVTAARQALYEATAMARQAAQAARQERYKQQALADERARKQEEEYRALKRLSCQRELKKKYPPNQEMWREVAYLMTELQKLEKEERVWKQADKELDQQIIMSMTKSSITTKSDDDMDSSSDDDQDNDQDNDQEMEGCENENGDARQPTERQVVLEKVQDIQMSCALILESLDVLEKAMERTRVLQRQVAQAHEETLFGAYGGVGGGAGGCSRGQTKDLVRIMSQEDSQAAMQ
ncbi:hypothetical protein ACA910_012296 [Epithemia clementina (nom. ined.)]